MERVFAPLCRWIPAYDSPSVRGYSQHNLCPDSEWENRNLLKLGVMDGSFERLKEHMGTLIVALTCPRPLPDRPLPTTSTFSPRMCP